MIDQEDWLPESVVRKHHQQTVQKVSGAVLTTIASWKNGCVTENKTAWMEVTNSRDVLLRWVTALLDYGMKRCYCYRIVIVTFNRDISAEYCNSSCLTQ
jgi:hypothetical protein